MKITKKYFIFLLLLIVMTGSVTFLSGCSMTPTQDSVQNFAKEYLGKVVNIDLKKIDMGSSNSDESRKIEIKKYVEKEFKHYFTEGGYEGFVNDGVYNKRLNYFKEKEIKKILNIIITLNPSEGSDNKSDKIEYDYTIEYYIVDINSKSEKIVDNGKLEILKQGSGKYKINSDQIRYSDVFS